eukprot:7060098-Prymnesium_polylepis.2
MYNRTKKLSFPATTAKSTAVQITLLVVAAADGVRGDHRKPVRCDVERRQQANRCCERGPRAGNEDAHRHVACAVDDHVEHCAEE